MSRRYFGVLGFEVTSTRRPSAVMSALSACSIDRCRYSRRAGLRWRDTATARGASTYSLPCRSPPMVRVFPAPIPRGARDRRPRAGVLLCRPARRRATAPGNRDPSPDTALAGRRSLFLNRPVAGRRCRTGALGAVAGTADAKACVRGAGGGVLAFSRPAVYLYSLLPASPPVVRPYPAPIPRGAAGPEVMDGVDADAPDDRGCGSIHYRTGGTCVVIREVHRYAVAVVLLRRRLALRVARREQVLSADARPNPTDTLPSPSASRTSSASTSTSNRRGVRPEPTALEDDREDGRFRISCGWPRRPGRGRALRDGSRWRCGSARGCDSRSRAAGSTGSAAAGETSGPAGRTSAPLTAQRGTGSSSPAVRATGPCPSTRAIRRPVAPTSRRCSSTKPRTSRSTPSTRRRPAGWPRSRLTASSISTYVRGPPRPRGRSRTSLPCGGPSDTGPAASSRRSTTSSSGRSRTAWPTSGCLREGAKSYAKRMPTPRCGPGAPVQEARTLWPCWRSSPWGPT